MVVLGTVIAAGGLYWLSKIPVDGSYLTDILPGLLIVSIGMGGVFTGLTTAANAGIDQDQAGLAAGLLNTGQQLGAALGLATLSAVATAHTTSLVGTESLAQAATSGFGRALFVGSLIVLSATAVALLTPSSRQSATAVEVACPRPRGVKRGKGAALALPKTTSDLRRPGEALRARPLNGERAVAPGLRDHGGEVGETPALVPRDGQRAFVGACHGVTGDEGRAVRVAARGEDLAHRVAERQDQHPPVVERVVEREDGRLLAAVGRLQSEAVATASASSPPARGRPPDR